MKRLILLILLLLPGLAFGQKRTYIKDDYGRGNIFVVEDGGQPIVYLQVSTLFSRRDSVFFVVNEKDCRALQDYFLQLQRVFVKWSQTARKTKAKDYSKVIDIAAPPVSFMWKTKVVPEYGWRPNTFGPYFCRTSNIVAEFRVDSEGDPDIIIRSVLSSPSSKDYEMTLLLGRKEMIDEFYVNLDWGRLMRKYNKLIPKHTKEELDREFIL